MTTVKEKRARVLSPVSDSDDGDQENPKTHESGENGGTSRILEDSKGDDSENVLKSNTCFVCGGKDDWVLVCHGEECPLAIHQSCTPDEPDFDEFGNFYCPYCWYKRVVAKSMKLRKKLMVIEKFSKGRETLGGVDLGLVMVEVTEDIENVVEANVSRGNPSGNTRESDESYEKFVLMEKNQRMKEVAAESQSQELSDGDADVDEGRQQGGRFWEKNQETSHACSSGGGGRNGRVRCSETNREKVQVRGSGVCEERKQLRRCSTNHETAQAHSSDVGARKQRIYSEKGQKVKRVLRPHKRGVFINDEETQGHDFDSGERRSGQGFVDESNQQKKAPSTESCAQEYPRTDKRVLHGCELGEGRYQQRRHLKRNEHNETAGTGTQEQKVSKNGKRKREGEVERDGDDFYLAENQERQCQVDTKNDDATLSDQENGFRQDEQAQRNYASSSISSPVSTDNVKESNAASQQLALVIHPNACLQGQPIDAQPIQSRPYCSGPSKKPLFQPEKYEHKSHPEKNGAVSNDPEKRKAVVFYSVRKRKRLFWTQAEEEMLRVGVQKFPGYRNIPWRKILEYGRDVFQEERLPSDLKDKWKTMNKMSLETGKWVSLPTQKNNQTSPHPNEDF